MDRKEVLAYIDRGNDENFASKRNTGNPIDEDMHDQPYEYSPDYYSRWFNLANLEEV